MQAHISELDGIADRNHGALKTDPPRQQQCKVWAPSGTQRQIRILLVEENQIALEGIKRLLKADVSLRIVGTTVGRNQGLALCRRLQPDVVILDVHISDLVNLKGTLNEFHRHGNPRVLVLTSERRIAYLDVALASGISAYILRSETPDYIRSVIPKIMSGSQEVIVSREINEQRISLTNAELHLVVMLARGMKYQSIGYTRNTAPATVRKQCESLLDKLGMSSREELIAWAASNGYACLGGSV